jgi:hypothetical protein
MTLDSRRMDAGLSPLVLGSADLCKPFEDLFELAASRVTRDLTCEEGVEHLHEVIDCAEQKQIVPAELSARELKYAQELGAPPEPSGNLGATAAL